MRTNIAIGVGCLAEAVETCILKNAPEWVKSNMGAAAVLLGLLPTILSLAGPDFAEIGLLAQRRPFLASLIALGSPAVSPFRMFMSNHPAEILRSKKRFNTKRLVEIQDLGSKQKLGILAAEYLFASAAVIDVLHNSWQLGVQTLCSFWPDSIFQSLIWALTAVVAHSASTIATMLRVRITVCSPPVSSLPISSDPPVIDSLPAKLKRILRGELQLSGATSHAHIHAATSSTILTSKPETLLTAFVSWLTPTGTILRFRGRMKNWDLQE
jgi:hypothetical protein